LSAAAATHSSSLQGRTGGTASLATTPEVRWVVQISDADVLHEGEAGGSNLLASSPLTTPPTAASTAAAAAVLARDDAALQQTAAANDEEEEPMVEVVEDVANEP
jgi:hypothetical protein